MNFFILLIFATNFIRIYFTLSYELGWQNLCRDVPKPFNLLFMWNMVFLMQYIRSMLGLKKEFIKSFLIPFLIPLFLFVINLIFLSDDTYKVLARGLNFPIIAIFMLYYLLNISRLVYKFFWTKQIKSLKFENVKFVKLWIIELLVFSSIASFALIGMFLYELITQKDFVYATFPYVKSVIHLIMMIQVFLHPEILYGPQRVPLPIIEADEPNGFKPAFNWHTSPKEIKNKLDLELTEKFNSRINEIIKKLESKAAIQLIIRFPDINSSTLAEKLNIPRTYLLYFFKYHSDSSFVSYRSKIRVFHAINKMQEDYLSKNTMDALAKECGFSSYNPFYAAFKMETGAGPNEILAQLKNVSKKS
jgi:AraC-like DNA-binding protein